MSRAMPMARSCAATSWPRRNSRLSGRASRFCCWKSETRAPSCASTCSSRPTSLSKNSTVCPETVVRISTFSSRISVTTWLATAADRFARSAEKLTSTSVALSPRPPPLVRMSMRERMSETFSSGESGSAALPS